MESAASFYTVGSPAHNGDVQKLHELASASQGKDVAVTRTRSVSKGLANIAATSLRR